MRIGIIAEGFSDVAVIRSVVRKLIPAIDSFTLLRPRERFDETDLQELNFSNWQLVLESCQDEHLMSGFFEELDGEALLVVHIDTAERGEKGFDIQAPMRSRKTNYSRYSETLRENVRNKLTTLIPERFQEKIAYAIAIEETDAWLIPLFESTRNDTSSHTNAKEMLSYLVGKDKKSKRKFIDTDRKILDYQKLGKELAKALHQARNHNKSLDLFCIDLEEKSKNFKTNSSTISK